MADPHADKDRSSDSHAVLDEQSRRGKGRKIVTLLESVTSLKKAKVLDIGTGAGYIADELAKKSKQVYSVDITDERRLKKSFKFDKVPDEKLPFKDGEFDVVVSNHVVEHTPDQETHLNEALRVLKPGGLLYIATPNKLWLSDPHYKLPFVSWLPRGIASKYVRATKRGEEWDIYPLSILGLRKRTKGTKGINGLSLIIESSTKSDIDTASSALKLLGKFPRVFDSILLLISPTLIYIVEKEK